MDDTNYKIEYLQGKVDKLEASQKERDTIIINLVKKIRSLSENIVGLENAENVKQTVRKD